MIYSRFVIAILIFTMHIIAMPPAGPITEPEISAPLPHATNPSLHSPDTFKKEVLPEHLAAIVAGHPYLPKQYHSHLRAYVAMAHDEYQNLINAIAANFGLYSLPPGPNSCALPFA